MGKKGKGILRQKGYVHINKKKKDNKSLKMS